MEISLIVAASKNRIIGAGNDIPWHLPDDLKFFKKTTSGHPIIMGRKTWESIGRPLPKRINIIVTRSKNYEAEGALVCSSISAALQAAKATGTDEAFIIGGGQIYSHSIKYASRVYLTHVDANIQGDVYFSALEEDWELVSIEAHAIDEKHKYNFEFRVYTRAPEEEI
ncbi:MAG: dihydrofolate reductase [Limisphaerales bacterium]|jgi:dihydrofolate reductase